MMTYRVYGAAPVYTPAPAMPVPLPTFLKPSGETSGLATWQKGLLIFAALGMLGFVYLSRPETEEEKRYYRTAR